MNKLPQPDPIKLAEAMNNTLVPELQKIKLKPANKKPA